MSLNHAFIVHKQLFLRDAASDGASRSSCRRLCALARRGTKHQRQLHQRDFRVAKARRSARQPPATLFASAHPPKYQSPVQPWPGAGRAGAAGDRAHRRSRQKERLPQQCEDEVLQDGLRLARADEKAQRRQSLPLSPQRAAAMIERHYSKLTATMAADRLA